MRVGFIGLGRMGAAMATNLLKAGHELTVYNRTAAKARPLIDLGAVPSSRVEDACRGDAVLTMVANDAAVEDIVFGDTGILNHLPAGATHVSFSTVSVALSDRLAQAHADAGQGYVAAPVFGRPDAATAAMLFIVAAGAPGSVEACRPLLDAVGQRTFVIGDKPSMANLVKLSGNFLIASVIEALGEAIALVGKAGIEPHDYIDLLTSTLFDARVYRTYGALIADRAFRPAGFAAPLGYKDLGLTLAAAEQLRAPMPLASLLRDRFLALLANGGDELDWSAIALLAARDAGAGEPTD